MDAKKISLLRATIHETIAETEENILSLKNKTKPVSPDNAIGRISRMDAIGNKSVSDATLRHAKTKLTKLKYVLNLIDQPEFGICIECDQEIPFARIMAMPESLLCVQCAELAE